MRHPFRTTLALVAALAACAGPGSTPSDAPDTTEGMSGSVPEPMLERVVRQAADDAGVRTDEVAVLAAESVTWRDGSLGCPEPGRMHTQALVPGYRVALRVAGEEVEYHAS